MSFTNNSNTPWIGDQANKLYLQSGFTSTLNTSEDVSAIDIALRGISYDGINTPWIDGDDRLYLQSGQFSSTLKDSQSISPVDSLPTGITWDGIDSPWTGNQSDKLYLQSGQFTSTLKSSLDVSAVDNIVQAISYDGINILWGGGEADKLYLQSGKFTSTIKDSEDVSGVDNEVKGISWDGTDTPWCGTEAQKLYLQSGQFTSTVKDSIDVSGVDTAPEDIGSNQISLRINMEWPDSATAIGAITGPGEIALRSAIFLLGESSTDVSSFLEVFPDYDYAFPLTKSQVQNRSLSGKLYSYTFFTFNKFEIPESWVNSENRTTINSFWGKNTNLEFYTDYNTYPNSYYDVRITNDEEPYPQFVKPYFNQYFVGTLKLEEYN